MNKIYPIWASNLGSDGNGYDYVPASAFKNSKEHSGKYGGMIDQQQNRIMTHAVIVALKKCLPNPQAAFQTSKKTSQ